MRNLASIQRITSLSPIENADNIEVARVLGWNVVVKRGEFKVNDLVVYCEVDSILPERETFEFMRPHKFRVKTIKLRKQISQGLCFPLSILDNSNVAEGDDVTEILGVVKYEPVLHASLLGEAKGHFPSWLPKTDETRIQSVPWLLEKYKGLSCYVAEKIDGSSFSCYLKDGEFHVLSRNYDKKDCEGCAFWRAAKDLDIEHELRQLGRNIALQGELISSGIQKGIYKGSKPYDIKFFNVFDIDTGKYLDYKDFKAFMDNLFYPTVPILDDDFVLNHTVDELVAMADGKSKLNKDVNREGIVIRPLVEQDCHRFGRLSFKVISPQYLLKEK